MKAASKSASVFLYRADWFMENSNHISHAVKAIKNHWSHFRNDNQLRETKIILESTSKILSSARKIFSDKNYLVDRYN